MTVNKIVFECIDSALSSFEFIDKLAFYDYLKRKYNVTPDMFSDKFEDVHEALQNIFGTNHYKIKRVAVRLLNQRGKDGTYDRGAEVTAFGRMVYVFIRETESNLKRNKSLALMSNYARNLESTVKETNEKLKTAERLAAIGETAAMVGHDIRNPLQAIVGELYLEKGEIASLPDCPEKKALQESVTAIEENIFYINKIVSDLQDFAKPLRLEQEAVDINRVISEVMAMVPLPSNLQVEIHVEDGFPTLRANFQTLKRSLSNLVQNAVQAMPDGGKLTIKAHVTRDNADIVVEDTGVGIPEEVKARLFRPLVTTKSKGQGLGLAVVKRLIEAQGGKVWFESEVGNGAKFIIRMPIKASLQSSP